MNIIEKLIKSKTSDQIDCEDGLFINENFIAVVDGATTKGKLVWDGKTSGRYAKDVILETLLTLDENVDAYGAIETINNSIRKAYKENLEIAKTKPEERMEASIIIFSRTRKEIWSFGDCPCIIDGTLYDHEKKIDLVVSEARSLYIQLCLLEGKTETEIMENDVGREFILPILKKQSLLSNVDDNEYGFAVIDGLNINLNNTKIYKVKEGDEIILASDGYPKPQTTLVASEKYLEDVIENDPLIISKYKSTKCLKEGYQSFDDRTYIKFIV